MFKSFFCVQKYWWNAVNYPVMSEIVQIFKYS